MAPDARARLGGALFLAVGAFLAKLGAWDVLQRAASGEAVTLDGRAIVLTPFALVLGAAMLVGGERPLRWLRARQPSANGGRWTPGFVAVIAVLLALGLGLWAGLRWRLGALGFE